MVFSFISDFLLEKNYIKKSTLRYLASSMCTGLQAITVAAIGYTTDSWILCISIMTIGIGFKGASYMGHLGAVYDISPTYSGTVCGFVNMAGNLTGFITPLVAAAFTEHNPEDPAGWRNLFWTSCGLFSAAFIIFPLFIRLTPASFELQEISKSQKVKNDQRVAP
jgi:MFS family permease